MSLKDDYELLDSFLVEKTKLVEKYQHKKTKFTIYNIKVGGPMMNGLFIIPTETLSDDGCPHTLEHLVFLGSEDYPWKGYLDQAANLCCASGTNAFTDTDHTAYELTTAGSDGFFQALPIYLDHIFYPTITQEAFTTEIHHINGKGEDAGVVYCEMQERETKRGSIVFLQIQNHLYTTKTGYSSETGGLLKDIRELNVETIRKFHKDFYRPDNAALMVVGDCDVEEIFKSLEPIQKKILSKGELPPMVRPWSSRPTPFSEETTKQFLFPSEDESTAECTLTFEGPVFEDFDENDSILILLDYLTSGLSSPIGSKMIDCQDSYAPSVGSHNFKYERNFHTIWFDSCDPKKIDEIKPKFLSIIKNLVETKTFDLERIRDSILQSKLNTQLQIEAEPTDSFSEIVIGDFIYGNHTLKKQMNFERIFEILLAKDSDFWLDLMKKYLLDRPLLEIKGIPSIEESKRVSEEDLERLKKQATELGPEKLKQLEETLEKAKEYNNRPIDEKFFEHIKPTSPESIHSYRLVSVKNDKPLHTSGSKSKDVLPDEEKLAKHLLASNPATIPFTTFFNHVESLFINVRMGFNTNNLDDQLRDYLPLFMDLLVMSSFKRDDGTVVSFEQLDALILKYTIEFHPKIGFSSSYDGGDFAQYCFLNCTFKKDYYDKVIELIKDILCNSIIEPERIKIAAKKLLDNIPQRKENGSKMIKSVVHHNQYNYEKSNSSHLVFQRQFTFLKGVYEILGGNMDEINQEVHGEDCDDHDEGEEEEEEEEEEVEEESKPIEITKDVLVLIDQLKKVQDYFTKRPQEMIVAVGGNIYELESPKDPWIKYFGYQSSFTTNGQVTLSESAFQYNLLNKKNLESLMGSTLAIVTPGNGSSTAQRLTLNNLTYDDIVTKEYVSLYLAVDYLDQLEGPLWKKIRGGLAYGYVINTGVESGVISFTISRSSNPERALEVGKEIVIEAIEQPLDKKWLAGARSVAVFEIAEKEKNYSSLLEQAYFDAIRGWVDKSYQDFFGLFLQVTEDDIKRAIKKYLLPLFEDSTSITVLTSDAQRVEQFKQTYPNLQVVNPETYFV